MNRQSDSFLDVYSCIERQGRVVTIFTDCFARGFLHGVWSLGLMLFFNICLYKMIKCMLQCRYFGKPGNIRRGSWMNEWSMSLKHKMNDITYLYLYLKHRSHTLVKNGGTA